MGLTPRALRLDHGVAQSSGDRPPLPGRNSSPRPRVFGSFIDRKTPRRSRGESFGGLPGLSTLHSHLQDTPVSPSAPHLKTATCPPVHLSTRPLVSLVSLVSSPRFRSSRLEPPGSTRWATCQGATSIPRPLRCVYVFGGWGGEDDGGRDGETGYGALPEWPWRKWPWPFFLLGIVKA